MNNSSTIVDLWSKQVEETPEAYVVQYQDRCVTYKQLDTLSNTLALKLISRTNSQELVAVYMDSSVEFLVTILAVLKSGCAYLPLDINMPWKHTELVLRDSRVRLVITKSTLCVDLSPLQKDLVIFTDVPSTTTSLGEEQEVTRTNRLIQSSDLAYVIYTSGSTGVPHGCMVSHGAVSNLVNFNRELFDMKVGTRVLQYASLSFDASIFEIYTAILTGAQIILPASRELILPGEPLVNFLQQYQVNMMLMPPSSLAMINQEASRLSHLKILLVGGEKCPLNLPQIWISQDRDVFNAYGPTEATVYATIYKCRLDESHSAVPIGKALTGFTIELMDEEGKQVQDGEIGELCIGGIGMGMGYWRDEVSTTRRFVQHGDQTMFHTRDLARKLSDGNFEYLGRLDNQVKVRGFRVEPEAIEAALAQNNCIAACTVVAREDIVPDQKTLVAFVVPSDVNMSHSSLITQLKRHARSKLPHYMNPTIYQIVDMLPMMSNGSKVDRKHLVEYPLSIVKSDNTTNQQFRSDTERMIADIFEEVLNQTVSPVDNFFDLGGNSLMAASVVRKIEKRFNIQVPVSLLFRKPTCKTLSDAIEGSFSDSNIQGPFAEVIDYLAEAALDQTIKFPAKTGNELYDLQSLEQSDKIGQVFLTGATGFLGAHVVADILDKTSKVQITCLVRCTDAQAGLKRIEANMSTLKIWKPEYAAKLTIVPGYIDRPYLGLDVTTFEELASQTDIIYHIAADTSYVKPFSALKPVNVFGTHEMIRFAASGNKYKPFHFCSSMCVYGPAYHFNGKTLLSENDNYEEAMPFIYVENGYVRSKWVAEYLVRSAMAKGLDAMIYRPGFIQASDQHGVPNVTDFLCRMLKGCVQMGCYPDLPFKYWMAVPVNYVSQSMVHISLSKKRETTEHTFHLVSQRSDEPSNVQLFEMLQQVGYPLQKVSIQCWHEELERILDDDDYENALHPVVMFILEKVYEARNTILELHYFTPACTSENVDKLLEGSGIICSKWDQNMTQFYVQKFIEQGWMVPPQQSSF
jgi:amino acid adenylation domain-containing protein/thioester reductase-like protein